MAMPNNLVVVRHGHSEGNLAVEKAKAGDNSLYTPDFRELPGHRWRLTDEGRVQVRKSGEWIRQNIGEKFDRYYVSPYVRTRETAALLELPGAEWRIDQRLRERDWGEIGSMPWTEFLQAYPQNAIVNKTDGLYWRPPGGESIADVRLRLRNLFDTLHRECAGLSVVMVTHGEFMWAARAELEYMTDEQWVAAGKDTSQHLYNAQVINYSRLHPETQAQAEYIAWQKSVCPWKGTVDSPWNHITRKRFSNEELIAGISRE
jgi:broad specificity phosphatase PhoE